MTSHAELKIRISRLEAEVRVLRDLVRAAVASTVDPAETLDQLDALEDQVLEVVQRLRDAATS